MYLRVLNVKNGAQKEVLKRFQFTVVWECKAHIYMHINGLDFFTLCMHQMNLRTSYNFLYIGTFKRLAYNDQQHSGTWNRLFVDLPVEWYEIIFEVSFIGLEQGLKAALDNIIYQPMPCIHSGEMRVLFSETPVTLMIQEGNVGSCARIVLLVSLNCGQC